MTILTNNLIYSISIFLIGIFSSLIISRISKILFKRISKRTKNKLDDFIFESITKIIKPICFILSIYFSIDFYFTEENNLISVLLNVKELLILVIIIKALNNILIRVLKESANKIQDTSIISMISSLTPLVKAFTWTIGSIFYLQNIGVQMTAIWALLSAGGIGAGLALKDPVQEFFEYITILLDKPFKKVSL